MTLDALAELRTLIVETHGMVSEMKGSCVQCQAQIQRHEVAINGNGQDGLRSDVAKLKDFRRNVRWGLTGLGTAIVALVSAAVSWALGLISKGGGN